MFEDGRRRSGTERPAWLANDERLSRGLLSSRGAHTHSPIRILSASAVEIGSRARRRRFQRRSSLRTWLEFCVGRHVTFSNSCKSLPIWPIKMLRQFTRGKTAAHERLEIPATVLKRLT